MTLDDAIRETVQKAVADEMADLRRAIDALKVSIQANAPTAAAPLEYASAEEAAAIAGVQPQTVRRWIGRGLLRGHHAGRLLRVRVDELRTFLATHGARPTDPPDDELLARRLFGK